MATERLDKGQGITVCAHCAGSDAEQPCGVCGRTICAGCAKSDSCSHPGPRLLRLPRGSRLRGINRDGRFGLVQRFGLDLWDLSKGERLRQVVSFQPRGLYGGRMGWRLLPDGGLVWRPRILRAGRHMTLSSAVGRSQLGGGKTKELPLSNQHSGKWGLSDTGKLVLVGLVDERIELIDSSTWVCRAVVSRPSTMLHSLAACDATQVVAVGDFGYVHFLEINGGLPSLSVRTADQDVTDLKLGPDVVVTTSRHGGGRRLQVYRKHGGQWQALGIRESVSGVFEERVALSPDGRLLAVARGRHIDIFDTQEDAKLQTLSDHHGRVHFVGFSADGQRLFSGDNADRAAIWPRREGRFLDRAGARMRARQR